MKPPKTLKHEFVEFIPDVIEEGKVFVSIEYATAVHKCCCGCGKEAVTPLSPTDWKLIFDGKTISLDPSIGNWTFPCRSHYWVKNNRGVWAEDWSQSRIDANRVDDRRTKDKYYGVGEKETAMPPTSVITSNPAIHDHLKTGQCDYFRTVSFIHLVVENLQRSPL